MKIITQRPIFFLIITFLLSSTLTADNDPFSYRNSLFSELEEQQYDEVTLFLDLDGLFQHKQIKNFKEQEVHIRFENAAGSTLNLPVKISPRGVYRRQFCDFPPLKLNFSKKKLKERGFTGKFDKYKLVTHCRNSDESTQTVLKEFSVYKMYNKLTPASFKVHLLKIKYQDIHDANYSIDQYAFIIEENDEMAKRLGGQLVDRWGTPSSQFTKESFYNTMVFNYMIGNLDWSIRHQKNLKFVSKGQNEQLILVPFDFDLCGIVSPEYAVLNADFNQKSIEDRFCKGKFENESAMLETVKRFQALKADFVDVYRDLVAMDNSHRTKMTRFLASFYGVLGDEAELEEVFLAGKYRP